MTTLIVAGPPAAGASYRKQSTGRTWHIDRITESGLVALTEEFFGEGCAVRRYVTTDELAADYAPAL